MKTITVVVPTFNEEKNIIELYERVDLVFKFQNIKYKVLFIDNYSKDNTRSLIRELASKNDNVEYIFNNKNYGFSRSLYYGLTQVSSDAAILLYADMQDPPEVIPKFVRAWESGYQTVIGIKNETSENRFMFLLRKLYYKFINAITDIEHIEQFDGFGLYDKKVLDIFRKIDDPLPYFRGIVAELAPEPYMIDYKQDIRKNGVSHFNFIKLYELGMLGITSYSKSLIRFSTFFGVFVAVVSVFITFITFLLKVFKIIDYPIGSAALIFGIFFIGAIQLIFLGILGEYIVNINSRTMKRPLVVEMERKINDV